MWDETDPQYSLETQDQIKKTKTSSCRLLRCIIVLSDVKWAIYQLRSYHGALSTFPLTVMASFTERCGIRLDSLSRLKRTSVQQTRTRRGCNQRQRAVRIWGLLTEFYNWVSVILNAEKDGGSTLVGTGNGNYQYQVGDSISLKVVSKELLLIVKWG